MDVVGARYINTDELRNSAPVQKENVIVVQPDYDPLREQLELLRFKLENHRQMTGSSDYALGYEEACMKVVEMIDNILQSCSDTF